jgi:nucleotide-binding universal stress UspA family protein
VGFQSILTYLPENKGSQEVVECSARLARECKAKLAIAEVLTPLPVYLRQPAYGYPALSDTLEREANEEMHRAAAPLRESGLDVTTAVLTGKAHEELVREALRAGHDLVIAPGHSHSGSSRATSTAVRLCRLCPVPVLAISAGHAGPFRRILATVDPLSRDEQGKELNERVIETALEVARLEGGEVAVLYVWGEGIPPESLESHGEEIQQLAESSLAALLRPYAGEIDPQQVLMEFGEPASTICRVAAEQEMDLVVLGTIARSGVRALWIGNTAEKTLAELERSVLAIKPSDFISPLDPRA